MNESAGPISTASPAAARAGHVDAARLFEAAAKRFAGRTAIVGAGGQRTYGELLERTGRFAAALAALGVGRGDRVVLMLANGIGFIEAWWGVVRAGAVVVPINPGAPADDLLRALAQCGAAALVVGGAAREAQAALACRQVDGLRVVCHDMTALPDGAHDYEALLAGATAIAEAPPLGLDAPCAMYFTAGSTGRPKGVLRSHRSVVWGLAMLARRLEPRHVLLARAPMAHTGGSLTGPFAVLVAGGTLVIPADTAVATIAAAVARHRVTHLYVHPTVFAKALLAHVAGHAADLGSLEHLQWTAGPLPEPVRAALLERFAGLPLETTFGMTEASNIAAYEYRPRDGIALKAANCVGYPLPGAEIRIDGSDGAPAPAGGEGEVVIRTPTALDGYWQDPETTAAAFTADGWLRTGDIGFLDGEGALHLNGRRREIIKTGGMTVHPAEVEQALAEHPHVVDAVVFGQAHADWDEAVVAAVSLRAAGAVASSDELIAHCRTRLAAYKLPKAIHVLAELPRNGSGKIDKARVVALLTPAREAA